MSQLTSFDVLCQPLHNDLLLRKFHQRKLCRSMRDLCHVIVVDFFLDDFHRQLVNCRH